LFGNLKCGWKGFIAFKSVLLILCLAVPAGASNNETDHCGFLEQTLRKIDFTLLGAHVDWKDRLRLVSREKAVKIQIGGIVMLDTGYTGSDSELERGFPGLRGYNTDFRRLRLNTFTTLYDTVDIKFEIDFARIREIKDIWVGLRSLPVVGDLRVGHMKEPFSLEELASSTNLTFMERALSTLVFAPSRDVGIMCQNTALEERMTWSAGAFMLTGSFSDVGNAKDQLSDIFGYAFTGRITGLPWHTEDGTRLMHVGLSYTYQDRNEQRESSWLKVSALPESYLTDKRLVNTGLFFTGSVHMINPEWAVVLGPLSFQAEYVQAFVNAGTAGDPGFWGGYLYGSYFLTGEHRRYDMKKGIFSQVTPNDNFQFSGGGWGAWELGLRVSYVDLNGGNIRGGKEGNLTAGLNWYIDPNIRIMFNYIHADVRDRAAPLIDNGNADIFQGRFQLNF